MQYLKANCTHLLRTLFPYSLPGKTARYKIWQLKYACAQPKRPAKIGDFETEIEKSAAITARLGWCCSQRVSGWSGQERRADRRKPARNSFAQVTALGEVCPAAPDRFSWLAGGQSTRPANMSFPLHGCLRDPPAGAASSATELLQTFLAD